MLSLSSCGFRHAENKLFTLQLIDMGVPLIFTYLPIQFSFTQASGWGGYDVVVLVVTHTNLFTRIRAM